MSNSEAIICENFEMVTGGTDDNGKGIVLTFDLDDIQPEGLGHIESVLIENDGIHAFLAENEGSPEALHVLFPFESEEQLAQTMAVIKDQFGGFLIAALQQKEGEEEPTIAFCREMFFD